MTEIGSPPDYLAALDCGSTQFKAALFDREGHRLIQAGTPVPYLAEEPDRTEIDPIAIWECARELLSQIQRDADVDPDTTIGLGITSQAQTFALFDPEGREPWTPFWSWRDGRARTEALHIQEGMGREFNRVCGFPECIPHLMAPKVRRALAGQPQTRRSHARIMTLPGYIAWRWAGIEGIDPNLAAMSGLYAIPRQTWFAELLDRISLSEAQLPPLVPTGQFQQRAPDGRPVAFCGNDQTAGAFGNGATESMPLITLGTALVAYRLTGSQPGPYGRQGIWGPYPDGGYYELTTSNQGCAALDWARRRLAPQDPDGLLRSAESYLARHPLPNPDLPLFYPEKTGTEDAWSASATPISLMVSTLEGIAFELQYLLERHFPPAPHPTPLLVTGGGARSEAWLRLIAATLNRPVYRAAGDALDGVIRMMAPSRFVVPPFAARFDPEPPGPARYAQRYEHWIRARP